MATAPMTIRVDEDFARFGGKSYAINKINSVEVRERQPHGVGGAVFAGVAGVLLVLSGFGGGGVGMFVIGAVLLGIAFWQWQRAKIREYLLFLMTSSSETQAFLTRDQEEVQTLRGQIERAMLSHSRRGAAA